MRATRTRVMRSALLAVAVLAGLPAVAAEPLLRWKFKAGDSVRYQFTQKNEFKGKVNGQELVNATDLNIDMSWKVKSVGSDGAGEIAMVIERVQAKIQVATQMLKYDSKEKQAGDDPSTKALEGVYRPAIGAEYTLKIDPRGQVLAAKVPDKVTEALQGSPFQTVADGGSVLSEKGLKNLFAQVIPTFPEASVEKGGTWKSTLELPAPPLRLTLVNTNTLASMEGSKAKIESKIDTTIKAEANSPFKIELKKQSGKGSYTVDTKAGRLTESAIHQTLELSVDFMDKMNEQVINIDAQMSAVP